MAMKLLAHILRNATSTAGNEAVPTGHEPRRWVLRDLVVRRVGFAPWGLAFAAPAAGSPPRRGEAASEPLWADTQPWFHR